MSARQLRKLEMLDAMAAVGDLGSSDEDLPETMLRPKARKKRQHRRQLEDAKDAVQADGDAVHEQRASASPSTTSGSRKDASQHSADTGKRQSKTSGKGGKGKGGGGGSRKKGVKLDDDDAFEAALQEYAGDHLAAVDGGSAETATASPTVPELLTADRAAMDPRQERIKSFGPSSVESLKPQHPQCPKFRPSALGTGDPNKWPPFDPLGLRLVEVPAAEVKAAGVLDGIALYNVDTSDSRFQSASRALQGAASSGDIHVLVDVWHKAPYHLPTLVQLHRTFATMGDVGEAQRCLDMALYTAGVVLSPVLGRPPTSAMLLASPGASFMLELLKLGTHNALRKGCAKTSLEVAKATCSADPQDSQRLLAFMDYIAVRASAWAWLATMVVVSSHNASLPIGAMPSWHFNAALGVRLIADTRQAGAGKKGGNNVAPLDDAVRDVTGDGGSKLLRRALLRFPNAATAIADRGGHRLEEGPWPAFIDDVAPALARSVPESTTMRHLVSVGAERCADLWKMPNAAEMLSTALRSLVNDFKQDRDAVLSEQQRIIAEHPPLPAFEAAIAPYAGASVDEVMGNFTGPAIPRELLDAEPTEEERRQAEAGQLDEEQRLMLERFEAAFGPLPGDIPLPHRMHMYEDMLQERVSQLGNDENAVALFFRTLLPWNTPRQMALQQALRDAGREDPEVVRRRELRRRQQEVDVEFVRYSSEDDDDDADAAAA